LPSIFSLVATNVDFDKAYAINAEIQKMQPVKNDEDALKLLKKNKELNLTLCENIGYPLMLDWARQLEDTAMRIYWMYLKSQKSFPYSMDQQGLTLEVMKNDEPARIQTVLHDILSQTEERILKTIFTHEQFYSQDLIV